MTSSLKKLLADCFKTVADGPKTGLLAARAISNLEVFTLPVLLGDNTIFVCKRPFVTGSISGCVYDVIHASLISDLSEAAVFPAFQQLSSNCPAAFQQLSSSL